MHNETNSQTKERSEFRVKSLLFGTVIALPLLVGVINLVAFFIVDSKHPDGRVADDFYKKALAVHKNAEPSRLAIANGIAANLHYFVDDGVVEIQLLGDHFSPEALLLDFVHPVDAEQDVRVILNATADANYRGYFNGQLTRFSDVRLAPVFDDSRQDSWHIQTLARNAESVSLPDGLLWKLTL